MKNEFLRHVLRSKSKSGEQDTHVQSKKIVRRTTIDKLFEVKFRRDSFIKVKHSKLRLIHTNKINTQISPILTQETIDSVKDSSLIDADVALARLESAKLREMPEKKKQNVLLSFIFLILNLVLVFFIARGLLNSTENFDLGQVLANQGNRLFWLIGVLGCLALLVFCESAIMAALIKHTSGEFRPLLSYKVAILGKYYECVTPLPIGGEPAQMLYLSRHKVNAGLATSIPIIRTIVYNASFSIMTLLFFVFVMPRLSTASNLDHFLHILLQTVAVLGLILSSFGSFGIMFISMNRKFGKKLARGVVKLGVLLHIVRDYRRAYDKLMRSVVEFQSSMDYLKKNKVMLFTTIGFAVLEILSLISISFFVVMAFGSVEPVNTGEFLILWLECSTRFLICFQAAAIIPLPGGTGMMEVAYVCMFGGSHFLGDNIFWGFMTFRIMTFYQWILQGVILIIWDLILKLIVNTHNKRKNIKTTE